MSDLTNSKTDRQNILNNEYAIKEIEKACKISGIIFETKVRFIKEQVATFYDVDIRTIERYLEQHSKEFEENGYEVLKGKRLKEFITKYNLEVTDINAGDLPNTLPALGIFDFRTVLNIGMLLTESERAKSVRQMILDIVIDTINIKTGGETKYINQRDEDFLISWYEEENYRREFTDVLKEYVVEDKFKYATYTDKIYESIFKEKASEYRKILKLELKDKTRDTFYTEILDLIASYECGLADIIKLQSIELGRRLNYSEVDQIFSEFENQKLFKPLVNKAREKMASRDLAFRDALHLKLKEYIKPLQASEFERFLGEKSKELEDRMKEAEDVFKRLKERG
ncbi:MAG: DNA-binding protein [Clostridia bacterium]|nr:DNA-binding protein [Clostridia bacterium]MDD4375801.1 DNA-binding protein [Clostridia bacterium]